MKRTWMSSLFLVAALSAVPALAYAGVAASSGGCSCPFCGGGK